jgi:DNA polymerase-3 subunit delta
MKVSQVVDELAKGILRPAYLVVGAEPLLRDEALSAIETTILGDGPRDFNLDRLDIALTTPGRMEEALGSLPMMASHRLVVLRGAEGRGGKLDVRWAERLDECVTAQAAGASTILVVVAAKVDKRQRWVKAFKEPAALIECDAPTKSRDIAAFLKEEAKRQGVTLDADAAGLLAERIGPQLLLLRQEIEKAALVAGPGLLPRDVSPNAAPRHRDAIGSECRTLGPAVQGLEIAVPAPEPCITREPQRVE